MLKEADYREHFLRLTGRQPFAYQIDVARLLLEGRNVTLRAPTPQPASPVRRNRHSCTDSQYRPRLYRIQPQMMSADDSHKHHNVADYGVALGKTGTDWWCAGRGRAWSLSRVARSCFLLLGLNGQWG
jgi:hypothetical protein